MIVELKNAIITASIMKLEALQKEIIAKEKELLALKDRLSAYPNVVLMRRKCKDKYTFVLQPIRQIDNLKANGWTECDVEDLIEIMNILNEH